MRLIDADELLGLARTVIGQDDQLHKAYFSETIDEAPTVEAIPVELIYKIRNLYLENECFISVGVCNEILNMWEKENEDTCM